MKGVGKKKNKILEHGGILTMADLVTTTEQLQGFTIKTFHTLKSKLPSTIPPTTPSPIDYQKYENPYLSLYGNKWWNKIKSTTAFTYTFSIRDLVLHIISEIKKVFTNNKYNNNCYFYHDTLT